MRDDAPSWVERATFFMELKKVASPEWAKKNVVLLSGLAAGALGGSSAYGALRKGKKDVSKYDAERIGEKAKREALGEKPEGKVKKTLKDWASNHPVLTALLASAATGAVGASAARGFRARHFPKTSSLKLPQSVRTKAISKLKRLTRTAPLKNVKMVKSPGKTLPPMKVGPKEKINV